MSNVWMPLYVGDYLADTMHLTTEEHGAYLLLIMAAWKADGGVPDDDASLAAITRLAPRRWAQLRGRLAGLFVVANGCWTHKRVAQELEKAASKSKKAAQSARNRWGDAKDKRTDMRSHSEGNAESMLPPSPSHHSLPSVESERARAPADVGHGVSWPVPEQPPPWAPYEAELRGLPSNLVPEVYTRWRDLRMARGITPADPVADWRAWCSGEVKRLRDGGPGPPAAARRHLTTDELLEGV